MVGDRELDWMRETSLELGEAEAEEYEVYNFWPSLQIVVAEREEVANSYGVRLLPFVLRCLLSLTDTLWATPAHPVRLGRDIRPLRSSSL